MRHLPAAVLITAFLPLTAPLLRAAEEAPTAPDVIPVATAPIMTKAPTVDGVIEDAEWPTLHVARLVAQHGRNDARRDLLQARRAEFWLGCDGETLYVAVRSSVHPDLGPKADVEPRSDLRDPPHLPTDDSVEIWIDNAPGDKAGRHYQFLVNARGAQAETMWDRKFNSERRWWRPETYRHVHKVVDGVWTVELAVPLADLGVEDLTGPLGVRVARNFQRPTDQSRWAPKTQRFSDRETMPRVRFVAGAPIITERSWYDARGNADVRIETRNASDKPIDLKVRIGCAAAEDELDWSEEQLTLEPGRSVTHERRQEIGEGRPGAAEVVITGADDAVLYHRDVLWSAKPDPAWESGEPVKAER